MTDAIFQAMIDKAERLSRYPTFVGVADLCGMLGVSERTVRRWQREGRMPPRARRGHRLVYQSSDFSAWLAEQVRG
ncbi:MAG TPA: DNA-binding protein [Aurantimonas coralicida]|uniref:DNA-binding protein n=2 Tax=root TaxID=1 RepID=A0A9C9NIW8_9HYPH|nr:DNA-binding protein [Aurantimonas coralicida]HEU01929.1 DNA-binding protein [Aurantimonas coralicida]